jgi:hypothetical protein
MALTKPKIKDIDTSIIGFNDPITVLHQGATSANVDVGFLFNRANGLVSNVAVYWSETGNTFVTAFTADSGVTNANVSTQGYANLTIGSLITVNGAGITLGTGAGFVLNGTRGNSGDVLTSTGGGVQWAAAGGFSGGVVPNQLIANASIATTTANTGAFIVPNGGMGVTGNLYVGGISYFPSMSSGNAIITGGKITGLSGGTGNSTASSTQSLVVSSGGSAVTGDSYFSATVGIAGTTQSTSATTGALTVAGGVGITKDLYVGGNVYTANLVATSSTQLSVQDPMLYLTSNVLYPWNYDTGIYSDSIGGPANVYVHHGMVRDYTTSTWNFFSNVKSEPSSTVNWSDAGIVWDTVKIGNITVVGNTATRGGKPIVTNYTGNTAPSNPVQGDEWFRANTSVMYKYLYDNISSTYNWVDMTSGLYSANTSAVANTLGLRDSNASLSANVFIGKATSAQYADLAEIYEADRVYEPGTVVVFGGAKEITSTKKTHDTRVAGVISTAPAYLMNSEAAGLPVAFTGRVPCRVKGPVSKGDVLVTSAHETYAERITSTLYQPGCILGKSLGEVADNEFATIEVVVGRF